jgi:hypothetical protein
MARGRTSTITIACAKPGSSIGEAFILGLDFRSTVMDAPEGNAVLFVLKIATAVKNPSCHGRAWPTAVRFVLLAIVFNVIPEIALAIGNPYRSLHTL